MWTAVQYLVPWGKFECTTFFSPLNSNGKFIQSNKLMYYNNESNIYKGQGRNYLELILIINYKNQSIIYIYRLYLSDD